MGRKPYSIELTESDCGTIYFVGSRYNWSAWMHANLCEGVNELAAHEAWEFRDAVEADTEGNHEPLPMLNERSELYRKINALLDSIV